ncbi:hypothetical protein HWV62_13683 [Athelia sp. TMB]|nr:hypothetical protein HWV62_13683 [Athelia sp. TMB]
MIVLGGSSALNFMVWNRPSRSEYDAWEKLGNEGWNWDSMISYMKKAEDYHPPSAEQAASLHTQPPPSALGKDGPLKVSFVKYVSKVTNLWVPALVSLGVKKNGDTFSGTNAGASCEPSGINPVNSTRSYSTTAYLIPNAFRKNLAVLTGALVAKINWAADKQAGKVIASRVTFSSSGKTYTIKAKKEVIVSSGSVNTPQILELSGISSSSILAKAGIKQIVNLPSVGENLQDHSAISAVWERTDSGVTFDTLHNNATFAAEQAALYANNSVSILDQVDPAISYVPLSTLVGDSTAREIIAEAVKYVNESKAPYKKTLQQQLAFLQDDSAPVTQMELIGVDGFFVSFQTPAPNKTYTTFIALQQHLLSRGSIHINSSDPSHYPIIDANYFSAPFDATVATAGLAYLRKIAASPEYVEILGAEVVPGTGADLLNYTRSHLDTEYHPIGTASMLPRNEGGVVDSSLKVYGTANVRVVDASIIPLHVSAHIQATIYAIAEKAAHIILADS